MPSSPDHNLIKIKPEDVVDELYGPPKSEGQRKLDEFKKKEIPKPEKAKESIIRAESPKGQELVFDFEQIRQHWADFYAQHNLKELAESIENTQISLTAEQTDQIIQKAKEGFDYFIFLPPPELQKQHLAKIKDGTEKPIPDLKDNRQYREIPDNSGQKGVWLSETVEPNFPNSLEILNRTEDKPYLLFIKDIPEVEVQTKNQTADQLRETFKQRSETGLTLAEYLIFQRDYTQRHPNEQNPHPDTKDWTWLLDEESPQRSGPARVLSAHWSSGYRRVGVSSSAPGGRGDDLGARSSAIFEII